MPTVLYHLNGIDYPGEMAGDVNELASITHAFLSALMRAGVPGEMHADLLGEFYAEQPQRLKRVMAFQIARRERMAWEAENTNALKEN